MSDTDETPAPRGRLANGRFGAGNPGRPVGAPNKVSRRVALAVLSDFEANQAETFKILRRWHLRTYVQLVGRLLPRRAEMETLALDDYGEEELAGVIQAARAALDRIEAGRGTMSDLEAALLGAPTPDSGPRDRN